MMADGNYTTPNGTAASISRAIKGEFALGVTRALIMVGIPAMGTLGGYFGVRLINQLDKQGERIEAIGALTGGSLGEIRKTLAEQTTATTVLQSAFTLRTTTRDGQVQDIKAQIVDHEGRIRALERPAGLAGPR
jgi:uncharacterized protein YcfJ